MYRVILASGQEVAVGDLDTLRELALSCAIHAASPIHAPQNLAGSQPQATSVLYNKDMTAKEANIALQNIARIAAFPLPPRLNAHVREFIAIAHRENAAREKEARRPIRRFEAFLRRLNPFTA